MGESQDTLFQPEFNRSIQVEARAERVSADAGALLLRELMQRSGLVRMLLEQVCDVREAGRAEHPFAELLLTWLLLDAQGWSDQLDVTELRDDPLFRLAVSTRRGQRPVRPAEGREPEGLCSQPTLSRLLQALALPGNRAGLGEVLLAWAESQLRRAGRKRAEETLDLDSVPVVVHGQQPGSAYNGHYHARCYHPVLVRSASGFYLGAQLRAGDVHTADGSLAFVLPIARRARCWAREVWIRMDAGFPEPELLRVFEAEAFRYVARVRGNQVLERLAAPQIHRVLKRAVPREERTTLVELCYQAGKWEHSRRVVLVMIERPGELFLDHFFLLTNAPAAHVDGQALLARYRERGIAEKDLGDWKNALDVHLSSTPRPKRHYREQAIATPPSPPNSFGANEANLLLSLLSANVLQVAGALLTQASHRRRSRDWFRQHVLKVPCRVTLSSRSITVVIGARAARCWTTLWTHLRKAFPVRGSPHVRALPARA
jgi:Transposase DDE domain group 1